MRKSYNTYDKNGANLSVEYTYDGNGSLTSDANKGISLIEYDDMNMPRRIQFANGNKIEYVYTAEGKKLRTIYYTASTEQKDSTEYLFGGMLTRENGVLNKYLFDGGYYSFDNNAPTCHYYNRDHLGNIREVISETAASRDPQRSDIVNKKEIKNIIKRAVNGKPAKDAEGKPAGKGHFHNNSNNPNLKFKYKIEEIQP